MFSGSDGNIFNSSSKVWPRIYILKDLFNQIMFEMLH